MHCSSWSKAQSPEMSRCIFKPTLELGHFWQELLCYQNFSNYALNGCRTSMNRTILGHWPYPYLSSFSSTTTRDRLARAKQYKKTKLPWKSKVWYRVSWNFLQFVSKKRIKNIAKSIIGSPKFISPFSPFYTWTEVMIEYAPQFSNRKHFSAAFLLFRQGCSFYIAMVVTIIVTIL